MKKLTYRDSEQLSRAAADRIIEKLAENPRLVICLATGASPARTYELLADARREKKADFSFCRAVKLDEWGGLPPEHPATCEHYLRKYFIEPLGISEDRYLRFRGDVADPEAECKRVQAKIQELGGIDLCILGLGMNGHLGLNEPADFLQADVHVAQLTAETQAHQMIGSTDTKPTFGITLGMANLLSSKEILMLVSGSRKKEQQKRLLEARVSTSFPASFLHLHQNVTVFTDIE